MRIISRYVAKEYTKVLLICFASVATIYLLAHFLGKLDDFIEYKATPSLVGTLLLLRIPRIYYEVLPIVVLLGTIITLGMLSRNNEIIGLRSGGISLVRLLVPILTVTSLLIFCSFLDGEWGVPYSNQRMHYLNDVALKKRSPILALKNNRIWFRASENSFCNIQKVRPESSLLQNVTLYTFNNDFTLQSRVDAERVTWEKEQWVTEEGTEWLFSNSGAIEEERRFQGSFPLAPSLEEIIDVEKSPKEMGYKELRDYIRILKRTGYVTTPYQVDLYAKISYSAISLIMILIGIPFALNFNRRGGIALSIGLSLGIGFLYWVMFSVGISLGYAGFIPPLFGAWAVNILFGIAALLWTLRIRY